MPRATGSDGRRSRRRDDRSGSGAARPRPRELELEAGVADHLVIGVRRRAAGRQVALGEDRVRRVQRHRLQRAQRDLAAAGDAQVGARVHEAEHAQRAQRVARLDERIARERRARPRVEEVDRHRVDVELAQREREVEQVVLALAEPDDAAAAGVHAGALRDAARSRRDRASVCVETILLVVALAGLEVVVEAIDAGRREPLRLGLGEEAERRAQLDVRSRP